MLMHTILVFLNNCSTNFLTILIKKIRIPVKEVQLKSIQRTSGFFYLQLTYFYPGKLTGTKFDFWKKNRLPLRTIFTSPIRESLVVCLQPVKIATL